ncbi:hypothetical protein CR513_06397, partial [Mucuna pruriens]
MGANQTPQGIRRRSSPVITFDDRDLKHGMPSRDEPMVKLKLPPSQLAECSGTLYGFAGEQRLCLEKALVLRASQFCTQWVDVEASYNIITGKPTLNRLGVVVSTLLLCMKFPIGQKVGSACADSHVAKRCYEDSLRVGSYPPKTMQPIVNVLDLDLDPRRRYEHERPYPAGDLKEIQVGLLIVYKTKIGMALNRKDEAHLVSFLKQNNDVFAWTMDDMPSIEPDFMCDNLSMVQGAKIDRPKETQVGGREAKGRLREDKQIAGSRFHKESTVPDIVGQRGDGQES